MGRWKKLVLTLFVFIHPGFGFAAEEGLKEISLMPQWIPQAQFAGYMVAYEKGFYEEFGLNMNLMKGGPGKPPFEWLRSGQTTFCTGWLSNAIEKRAAGLRIVNIAQVLQRSALMLVARKSAGILRPKDLQGKRVGLWSDQFFLQPRAFFRKYNLSVEIIPNFSSIQLFLKRGVHAMAAMWYNEYHTIINSGLNPEELTLFFFRDIGLNFPEDGLYCLEETYEKDPEACARFAAASLKGWAYTFENMEEALEIVMKHADEAFTGTNRAHQRWMLARMKDLILPQGAEGILGKLDPEDYSTVGKALRDFDLIEQVPPFDRFYRGPR